MVRIEINNQTTLRVLAGRLQSLSEKITKQLKLKGDYQVSLALVSPVAIKNLNRKYRRKDKVTDVLSFEDGEKQGKEILLGEIVICSQRLKAQAREFKHSDTAELQRLFTHGFLHLLGFDHEVEAEALVMEALERKILGIK